MEGDNQSPVYQALHHFFECYLIKRDVEQVLPLVSDDIYSIGTGKGEIATDKEQFKKLIEADIAALPFPIFYQIIDYHEVKRTQDYWDCFCQMKSSIYMDNQIVHYSTRLTASFHYENNHFIATSLHMSEASSHQEENEFFPLRFACHDMNQLTPHTKQELKEIICQIMPGGIIGGYLEEGFPLYVVNDNLLKMLGYSYDEFVSMTNGMIINSIYEDDRESVTQQVYQAFQNGYQYEIEYRVNKKDGSYLWVYDIGRKICTEDQKNAIISVLIDISDSVKLTNHLKEESIKDSLTGVYNRKGGESFIAEKMNQEEDYIFLMVDLDNFKAVNDTYGHYAGDTLLQYLAKLIQSTLRQTDIIFRMGGDEFGIFIPNCHQKDVITDKMNQVIQKYSEKINENYFKSHSSVSFGGIMSHYSMSFTDLYKKSDEVLYDIKHTKKGQCVIKEL